MFFSLKSYILISVNLFTRGKNMNKIRTNTKIAAVTAVFTLAAAFILSACTNPSDSSGGNGGTPETPKYEVVLKIVNGSGDTVAASYDDKNISVSTEQTFHNIPHGTSFTFTAAPKTMDSWTVKKRQVKSWSITKQDGSVLSFINGGTAAATNAEAVINSSVTVQVEFEFIPAETGKIRISIAGDERVDTVASDFTDINPNETWQNIKTAVANALQLKSEWQSVDYGVDAWKLSDADGNEIGDSDPFTVDTTVYAVTNYTKFNIVAGVLTGYTGSKPKGNIILPSGITKIDENAFKECTELTGELVIPNGVTEIGYNSFKGCSNLTGLVIPAGVTKIDAGAFSGCEQLKDNLSLPSTLTYIGGFAFYECKNIPGELDLPANITFIGDKAFSGCKGFTSIMIRSGNITTMGNLSFDLKSDMSDVHFTVKTDGVKTLLKSKNGGIPDAQITVDPSI